MSRTRLQDEYNRAIREADVFVMLFWRKVGKYTNEEFEQAFGQFQARKKPFIFVYSNDKPRRGSSRVDAASLDAFRQRLEELGHFPTRYKNIDRLTSHFERQLDKLVANRFIEFPPPEQSSVKSQKRNTTVVKHGDVRVRNNKGSINTGTQVNVDTDGGAYVSGKVKTRGGHFIGRDFIASGRGERASRRK